MKTITAEQAREKTQASEPIREKLLEQVFSDIEQATGKGKFEVQIADVMYSPCRDSIVQTLKDLGYTIKENPPWGPTGWPTLWVQWQIIDQ